jgi:hypothetical protein
MSNYESLALSLLDRNPADALVRVIFIFDGHLDEQTLEKGLKEGKTIYNAPNNIANLYSIETFSSINWHSWRG